MNRNNKTPLVVAAVLVAAVVIGTIAMRGQRDPARDAALSEAPAANAVAQTAPAPGNRPSRSPARQGASTEAQLIDHVARRAQRRDEQMARTAALKKQSAERFAAEQVDPAWAPQKEAELAGIAGQSGFETAGVRPTSLSMDCKSSMCKIDGQFASNGEAEDWILIYMSSVGSAMPSSVVSRTQNPDGSTRVEIYGRAR
ncbi:hypothetical protein [Luteimonas sp. MC1572]|uniref:hypothetical protein n=1 Tax=Luteimonas sp. MC1572 TaxID=2799325 RepID=UPI0018F0C11B|nr:hypothetical protein [Luteimonas sp. MC1572]MBJ6980530.1 hypothetical protein [Luteimonas sp. MC1572]QQO04404.1 hypothetical protein JGR64_06625 [Luteimonas sp. MC1572]